LPAGERSESLSDNLFPREIHFGRAGPSARDDCSDEAGTQHRIASIGAMMPRAARQGFAIWIEAAPLVCVQLALTGKPDREL
jgi:hypothetical protein